MEGVVVQAANWSSFFRSRSCISPTELKLFRFASASYASLDEGQLRHTLIAPEVRFST
jgi:hypothetical protein